MRKSADVMAETIMLELHPTRVVDVGCGTGALLMALTGLGAACRGLDVSPAAISICTGRGLSVRQFNLESDEPLAERADVVISTEVAEHLPLSVADHYVDVLCSIAPTVVFTAAVPGGPAGMDHVNEQPNEYWVAKFEAREYCFDSVLSHRWRNDWRDRGVSFIYYNTIMVFRHNSATAN